MPGSRWIEWEGRLWRLSRLAEAYRLRPQTLASRLDRGYPLARALATGLCPPDEAGRRGSATWRGTPC
jgi:hypothetical protein